MIGTIRKHSKILWVFIITIVIITFVFWDSQPSNQGNQGEGYLGSIGGEPVELEDYRSALREIHLLYYFSTGEWPGGANTRPGFDIERETYSRLLMLKQVKQQKIHVADETVARVASELLRALNRGVPVPVATFEQNILRPQGLTAMDFERYLRNYLGIQQLISAHGLSGRMVTPQEARILYEREHEEILADAVFFTATNHLSTITTTPERVGEFFTNQMARYRLPERAQVLYVAFEISNQLAQAEAELVKTNLTERIETAYLQLGTNYYKEATTPEGVRAKIREDLIRRDAERLARRQANDFASAVDSVAPKAIGNFEKLAAERNLTVKTSEPFDREDGPQEFVVGADFIRGAFSLMPDEPFAGPFVGRDAAYAIAFRARLASAIPPLETILERVTADYRYDAAVRAAHFAGEVFMQFITNGLTAGKTFATICTEADVKRVTLPPFSLSTRSVPEIEEHVNLSQFKSTAFTTPLGKPSVFVGTAVGGYVVLVRERLPMDQARLAAALPEFLNLVRQTRQNEAYNDWFRREAERNLRDTPIFRQQSQPGQPPGTPGRR